MSEISEVCFISEDCELIEHTHIDQQTPNTCEMYYLGCLFASFVYLRQSFFVFVSAF